jgi:hypothetical protein
MSGESQKELVALRDRREAVIQILSDQFASDGLDVDAFEQRLELAHRYDSIAELDKLVADLTPVAPEKHKDLAALVKVDAAIEARRPASKRFIAIFGGFDRSGGWIVPREMSAIAIMGGGSLDFREGAFAPGVTELNVTAIWGGVEIIVPPHLAVEVDGTAIMGGFENRGGAMVDPDRPLLRISGLVIMGGVEVSTRLPGESAGQARRRARRERKALARGAAGELGSGDRRALPPKRDD